jgi:CubicO group peptidase (beta-lactamase class C family)
MGAVLVARDGKVLLNKGYGMANVEWEIPATPTTKFRIGSITKQFTAAAILLLEQRDKLDVDDLVKKHLPDAPAAWDKITLHQLLTHQSGIPSYTSSPDYLPNMVRPLTTEQLVALFKDKPLDFEPGTKFNYSNSGYALLGFIIEKIAGEPYGQFVARNMFAPLGMKDTGYDTHAAVLPRRAAGYTLVNGELRNASYLDMSQPHAAGALYSTTEDLRRWTEGLLDRKLLSLESLRKMISAQKNNYAMGMVVTETHGRQRLQHSGGINGFNGFLAFYPSTRTTIAVLSNVNGTAPDEIGEKLGALVHGEAVQLQTERKELTLTPAQLAGYIGTYTLENGATVFMRLDGTQLTTQIVGQPVFPLYPESERRFFLKVVDAQVEFSRDLQGAINGFALLQGGRSMKGTKTAATAPPVAAAAPAVSVPKDVLATYVGTYTLAPGFDLQITVGGESLMAQATGQGAFPLTAQSPTRFVFPPVGVTIEFVTENGVTMMQFTQQGALNVKVPKK